MVCLLPHEYLYLLVFSSHERDYFVCECILSGVLPSSSKVSVGATYRLWYVFATSWSLRTLCDVVVVRLVVDVDS